VFFCCFFSFAFFGVFFILSGVFSVVFLFLRYFFIIIIITDKQKILTCTVLDGVFIGDEMFEYWQQTFRLNTPILSFQT